MTVTAINVEKVTLGTGKHKKKYLVLCVGYSGGLNPTGAQDLSAYTVHSGTTEKVNKVKQVVYNKLVPLTQAIYFPSQDFVALVPKGQHRLPKLEQVQVNVSIVTDPEGRPINNGQNLTATVTSTGLVISEESRADAVASRAASVDALFDQETDFAARNGRKRP